MLTKIPFQLEPLLSSLLNEGLKVKEVRKCIMRYMRVLVAQSQFDSLRSHDGNPPVSSICGISQASILKWVVVFQGICLTQDWTQVFPIAGGSFSIWATREPQGLGQMLCEIMHRGISVISAIINWIMMLFQGWHIWQAAALLWKLCNWLNLHGVWKSRSLYCKEFLVIFSLQRSLLSILSYNLADWPGRFFIVLLYPAERPAWRKGVSVNRWDLWCPSADRNWPGLKRNCLGKIYTWWETGRLL